MYIVLSYCYAVNIYNHLNQILLLNECFLYISFLAILIDRSYR